MEASSIIALVGVIASALGGAGGVLYAVVQGVLKRGDKETQANAAQVLTNAASSIIAELQQEKKDLRDELLIFKSEVASLRQAVHDFIEAVEAWLPIYGVNEAKRVRDAMKIVKTKL